MSAVVQVGGLRGERRFGCFELDGRYMEDLRVVVVDARAV
jgi:hypothetical protein